MNSVLEKLSNGDLRSDGMANEVALEVLQSPELLPELILGLDDADPAIRAHAADALEKVAREQPDWMIRHLPCLVRKALTDELPMVRWHMAMIFGCLDPTITAINWIVNTLIQMLGDESIFVRSWVISSLCILGKQVPEKVDDILINLRQMEKYESPAIRSRIRKGVEYLRRPSAHLPADWSK